ncbi:MAG: hypothetical protein IT350_20975 [Deltaproteobacteria bacterium]|nr:hypothetical protein [Deltaproteobacteria bacterium]
MTNVSTTPKNENDKASVLSNVANILGVSGTQEGRVGAPDEQALAKLGVEPDHHPVLYFWGFLAATTLFVIFSVAGVWQFVGMSTQAEVLKKDLSVVDSRLPEVRAYEAKLLGEYDLVDGEKGLYRIPVAEATKIIVSSPKLVENVAALTTATAQPAAASPTTEAAKTP